MEVAKLADVFVAARKKGRPWSYNSWRATKDNHKPAPQSATWGDNQPASRTLKPSKKPVCYLCGVEGHTKLMCLKNSAKMIKMCFVPPPDVKPELKREQSIKMTSTEVNGTTVTALLDS